MTRTFRVYQKKRGDRRTGSELVGSLGEALFFACIIGIGALVLVLLLKRLIIPEWRANHAFEQTTSQVFAATYREVEDVDGPSFVPQIWVAYEVDGVRYHEWTFDIATKRSVRLVRLRDEQEVAALAAQFDVGGYYYAWYDPSDPRQVVLLRGYTWWLWVLLLLPIAFIGIGGVGLVFTYLHWGKSSEHRIATVQRAASLPRDPNELKELTHPAVPRSTNWNNSPGTALAYRLPIHASHTWKLFTVAAVCLIWNSLLAMFLVMAIRGHLRGEPDWILTLFTVPFLIGGIGLAVLLARHLIASTGVGPTQLEISDHPLIPGSAYELLIQQFGRLHVRSFVVLLVCEEEANYHEGTDIRTERRRVVEREVYRREKIDIEPAEPFQDRCRMEVPASAMHSFSAGHNEVQWWLVARVELDHWPSFERFFPVLVYPAARKALTTV